MITRRALLAGLGTLGLGCKKRDRVPTPEPAMAMPLAANTADAALLRGASRLLPMTFDSPDFGPLSAVIIVPAWGGPNARFPLVVALHGRGEALKGPELGAMGWPRDYALVRAIDRICAPPITYEDMQGFVDPLRLARLNSALAARPYGGLIIACPYVPDLDLRNDAGLRAYGHFITDALVPRVRRETPAIARPEATGIDGVSLGGVVALSVGLNNPSSFGSLGALQAAVGNDEIVEWTERAGAAVARNPGLSLRLLTSTEDMYRPAINKMSEAWGESGIPHEFVEVPGPHDYPFNRGPGAYELLSWHDRALRKG